MHGLGSRSHQGRYHRPRHLAQRRVYQTPERRHRRAAICRLSHRGGLSAGQPRHRLQHQPRAGVHREGQAVRRRDCRLDRHPVEKGRCGVAGEQRRACPSGAGATGFQGGQARVHREADRRLAAACAGALRSVQALQRADVLLLVVALYAPDPSSAQRQARRDQESTPSAPAR